jgi:NADH-quinone oxidoreductase subunit H
MFSFWPTILTIVGVMAVVQGTCAMLIYFERKVAAYVQDRYGPNRVGPWGLFQSVADGLKFLLKEEVIPDHVDKFLFILAPALAVGTAMLAFAVVPFGPTDPNSDAYQFVIAPRVDIGIVFVFAVGSLAAYAIVLGGWASNSKYSFLGALRSSAQLISYEIPMGTSILGIVLMAGSLNLERIIDYQTRHGWFILYQPLAFFLFLLAVMAECNRLPFDLPEAEQELVGGYHTEYSAMKFALFFLGEYAHVITTSFLLVILFFGGWHFPGVTGDSLVMQVVKLLIFAAKMAGFIFFYMLIRWTIPRFRFDQLMGLAWKVVIPLTLLNLLAVMVVLEYRLPKWLLPVASVGLFVAAGLVAGNWPAQRRTPVRRELQHVS